MGLADRIRELIRTNPGEIQHDAQYLKSRKEDLLMLRKKLALLNQSGAIKQPIALGDSCERWSAFLEVDPGTD